MPVIDVVVSPNKLALTDIQEVKLLDLRKPDL